MNKPRAQQLNLRCRCGADGSPIPCKGGCDLICQRVDEREAAAVTRRLGMQKVVLTTTGRTPGVKT